MDDATKKWKEKISKAEARLAESVENVESAEKKAEAADEKSKNLKKELDAARAKRKEEMDAAVEHEMQHTVYEKGEIDSLKDKLESNANQTRTLEANLRKELEEKAREQKELEEKHKLLNDNYLDLQKELAGNKQHEGIAPQGMGLAGRQR